MTYEKITIFRIEHPESKQGPFTHDAGPGRFASDAMVYMKEPQEYCKWLGSGAGMHYAFNTIGCLDRMVQSYAHLNEYGFHIAVYESTRHVILPDGQVAFDKDAATLVETHRVKEFPFENYC